MLVLDERGAKRRLVECGISLIGPGWKRALERIDALSDFPPAMIIEQPGWAGSSFAMIDGTVFSPGGESYAPIAFDVDTTKCQTGGSFETWKSDLLMPLIGQSIPLSLFAMALASPLLEITGRSENFGLEIVGPARCGKSTCQFLAASMAGPVKNDSGGKYWISSDATSDGFETAMAGHSDMPMLINEANLFYADLAPRARGDKLKALAFRLAQGHEKTRHKEGKPRSHRFIYIMSTNAPLASLLPAQSSATAEAAADRLMTLTIDTARPHRIFDFVPEGYDDAEGYAKALERVAQNHHGHAMRKFLIALVDDRAADPEKLLRRIDKMMAKFRARTSTGRLGAVNSRIADAFALAYAAGELAKRYKVFPPEIYFGPALAKTYALVAGSRTSGRTFDEMVEHLASLPGVVDLDVSVLAKMDDMTFNAVPAFIRSNRAGDRETLVRPVTLEKEIPGWKKLIKGTDVKTRCKRDEDHLTQKRQVRRGKADRMIVLVAPPC